MKKRNRPQVDLNDFKLISEEPENRPVRRRGIDIEELDKLEATKRFGGLIPERSPILDSLCQRVGPLPK